MKILITGGTVFLSKITAEYYISRGHDVYVLNRNTKPQPQNANLIQADRHALGNSLRGCNFDVVIDVTAYNADDVNELVSAMGDFGCYYRNTYKCKTDTKNIQFRHNADIRQRMGNNLLFGR